MADVAPVEPTSTAMLSPCGTYRYGLTRRWGAGQTVAWVMLNPSTADASKDDATIRKCIGFSKAWGYDGLEVVNLFALRSTDPKALLTHPDPQGPENDAYLRQAVWRNNIVVAAWGAHKSAIVRGLEVRLALQGKRPLMALGLTAAHAPRHPLYVPYNAPLIEIQL